MEVAPKIVSTRVVKTVMVFSGDSAAPSSLKSTSVPALRPIQLRCMVRTFSGQPSSLSRPFNNSSEYLVVRRNHCSSSRCSTSVSSCRQQQPPTTCSFASTVAHFGHQLTLLFLRYASPRSKSLRMNHWFHL